MQSASPQLHRSPHPARRHLLLRHHPVVQRLSHVLLPHAQRRFRDVVAARRVHEGAGVDRRGDRARASRSDHRRDRKGVAEGDRLRLRQRDGLLRPAVRSRSRARPARAAHHQSSQLDRASRARSSRAWCSRSRPTARRPTGSRPPGSRKRSWVLRPAQGPPRSSHKELFVRTSLGVAVSGGEHRLGKHADDIHRHVIGGRDRRANPAGAVSQHARDAPYGEARLRLVPAEPRQGHEPSLARPGSDRGRVRRGDAFGRLHVRDLPRPRTPSLAACPWPRSSPS